MTKFQLKIQGILNGTYIIPQSDINLENRLWERHLIEEVIIGNEEEERIRKFKEYQRNYHREYYRRKLSKGKKPQQQTTPKSTKSRVKKYNSKICDYLGEEVKFGTLVQRLFKLYGSYPEATKKAKEFLRKS
ncbi:MAG: hypothetical protein J6S67_02745 [Methanobrevibacter sp.]|nr:hypothetical protein [Methanobrevibacter sp.]